MKNKIQFREQDGLALFRKPYTDKWYITGVDICRHLGYKNPHQQSKKIYNKFKEYFEHTSCVLELKREIAGVSNVDTVVKHKRTIPIRCYNRPGLWFFVSK